MKPTSTLTVLLALVPFLVLQPAFAAETKPSEQSVRQLLEAMHTGDAIKDASAHMDDMLREPMKEAGGRPLNAEQQKIREETRAKVVALIKEQLDWSTILEPIMVQSYRDTFTPEEVNALLKFYHTPIGRSVAGKLPSESQQTMRLIQQRIRDIMPKIQEIVRDSKARIQAAASAPGEPPQSGATPPQPH